MQTANSSISHLLQEAVNYSTVAGTVLLAYDVIINLSDEVDLIWSRRWSSGKIIYILARYFGIVEVAVTLFYSFSANLTVESCRMPYDMAVWLMIIGIPICHCVLIIRTFAIWEQNNAVLAYMCFIQMAGIGVKSVLITKTLKSATFIPSPIPNIAACVPSLHVNTAGFAYCIDVAFEFQILCLSLYKGFFQWKSISTPLIRTLFGDSLVYFAVMFCISLANTIVDSKMYNSFSPSNLSVAGIILLVYDVIINLSEEIELIWLYRWSFGKVIYILTRYSVFVDAVVILFYSFSAELAVKSCHVPYDLAVCSIIIGIAICQCVLVVRTYAIWERKTIVLAYLCIIQGASFAIKAVIAVQTLKSNTFIHSPEPTIAACISSLSTRNTFISYCVDVGFEFRITPPEILCLSLYKGFFQWRSISTPLAHTIYRDGFIYFVVMFCISLADVVVTTKMFNSPYSAVVIVVQLVFHSIFATRIIINLRKVVAEKHFPTTISTVSFRDRQSRSGEDA
ncbi:hypothetical protein SCHPADRAFT_941236 [Schizopora paradoxa]|uniref:DUF6533 domain-containing protein n=1 Tax=Schizopora paradoxa TaxID=27342 RepID=A0A0H2RSK2_9AGAM|nr:hypothetical protein SCHPADRAFT_941236 [Schizopora paradoxa]